MKRPRARKKRRAPGLYVLAAVVAAAGLSLAIRWSDLAGRFAGEEPAFQLEVLNGTRETGIAMETAKALRGRGVDVLIVDNAERFDFRESVLVDRVGDPRLMRRIAKIAGCRRIVEQVREKPLVDATFIVGADRVKSPGGT
jgi:hypothetical protein